MKINYSKESVRAILTTIREQNRPKKISVEKETEYAGECKKLSKAEGRKSYPTMIETKTVFAEGTILSLKNLL